MELRLDINEDIYERLATRAERYGFESTEAYTRTIVETVILELEGHQSDGEVEERLEDLGYL